MLISLLIKNNLLYETCEGDAFVSDLHLEPCSV